jgi:hypothetical protein
LRRLLSIHDLHAVFQLATQWESPAVKGSITSDLLHTIAEVSPTVTAVVPIGVNETEPRFQNHPPTQLRVGFVQLPELFGAGQSRKSTWSTRAFYAASQQRLIPLATAPSQPILDAAGAASAIVDSAEEWMSQTDVPEFGFRREARGVATARELFERLSKPNEAPRDELGTMIRQTVDWYEKQPVLLGTEAPRSRAA